MSTMEPNVGLEHMSLRSKPELGSRVRCHGLSHPDAPKRGILKHREWRKNKEAKVWVYTTDFLSRVFWIYYKWRRVQECKVRFLHFKLVKWPYQWAMIQYISHVIPKATTKEAIQHRSKQRSIDKSKWNSKKHSGNS